jgi:hypothetical protein
MMNRRSFFLQSSAAVAANQTIAASDKVNIACIGLGIRGFGTFRQSLKMPDVTVVEAMDLYDGHLAAVQETGGSRNVQSLKLPRTCITNEVAVYIFSWKRESPQRSASIE